MRTLLILAAVPTAVLLFVSACGAVTESVPIARLAERATGPGWTISIPADLRLEPGPRVTDGGVAFGGEGEGGKGWVLLAFAPADRLSMDMFIEQSLLGGRVVRDEQVTLPAGRARYLVSATPMTSTGTVHTFVFSAPGNRHGLLQMADIPDQDVLEIARTVELWEP